MEGVIATYGAFGSLGLVSEEDPVRYGYDCEL